MANNSGSDSAQSESDDHDIECENTERACLDYIKGSFRLLEQARAAVLNSNTQQTASTAEQRAQNSAKDFRQSVPNLSCKTSGIQNYAPQTASTAERSEWAQNAAKDFRHSFPGLSNKTSGRHMQTFLPSTSTCGKSRENRVSPYSRSQKWSGKVLNTWTHDFVALAVCSTDLTPTAHELDVSTKAGLGKQRLVFKNKHGMHDHIRETLEGYFLR